MTIRLLKAILVGLPESSVVKFVRQGELYDISVVGITRTKELPHHSNFNSIKESVVLTDESALEFIGHDIQVKKVWKYIEGKEAV